MRQKCTCVVTGAYVHVSVTKQRTHPKPAARDPMDAMQSPLSALEQSMGIARDEMVVEGGALDEEDPDETPPGRAAVSYSVAGDSLFSPPAPVNAAVNAAAVNDGEDGRIDDLNAGLMSILGDPTQALGAGGGALIAQLEQMAQSLEAQSGTPETEIRSKIALLRSVLDARPGLVANSRARVDAAVAALDSEQSADPEATAGAADMAALHSVCATTVDSIEGELVRVEATLESDPAAAALVSSLLRSNQ